jgi:predicted acylesterase/phospholipase RssA
MAQFSLSWRLEDYLDIQWAKAPQYAAAALKGITGLAKGDAIQRTFDDRFAALTLGELTIPISSIVFAMDRELVDYLGSDSRPDLTIGRLARIAIALPAFIEAVEIDRHLHLDGGIIDPIPIEPILHDGRFDHVFAINVMLPPQLEPDDITGSSERPMGVLKASRQTEQGFQVELARRSQRTLDDRLTIIDAADHTLPRDPAFYDLFIDRSRWPKLTRTGYNRTRRALDAFKAHSR